MQQAHSILNRILSALTAIAVVAMMLHVIAHALSRFLFSAPLYGTNEIVSFWWLPAIALLGIPAAHLQREHITVTLLTERLGPTSARACQIFAACAGGLLSAGLMVFGLREAIEKMTIGATAGVTEITTWPVYFLVPLVFLVMTLCYVLDVFVPVHRTASATVDPAESAL
ncbi:TRAP transporter small permease [Brevibacterium moorei]|uniref:TRAP transporter small permease n=1 Tax=Brevibacterium moorei TaxID=2968457 RepID=UPI00211B8A3B|nr:TRAP transporter small permease [Brevibacterium sp. 68QC2CO]MCQ9384204.1 TRAP transporter small permease [Brevibacterium sp. 68QC2CO]